MIPYPSIPSSLAPVSHNNDFPVPIPPQFPLSSSGSTSNATDVAEDASTEWAPRNEHHFPNQKELDDLFDDLKLTKAGAELLTSRLKEWNLLDSTCKVTH
jgi:hypothetical protein